MPIAFVYHNLSGLSILQSIIDPNTGTDIGDGNEETAPPSPLAPVAVMQHIAAHFAAKVAKAAIKDQHHETPVQTSKLQVSTKEFVPETLKQKLTRKPQNVPRDQVQPSVIPLPSLAVGAADAYKTVRAKHDEMENFDDFAKRKHGVQQRTSGKHSTGSSGPIGTRVPASCPLPTKATSCKGPVLNQRAASNYKSSAPSDIQQRPASSTYAVAVPVPVQVPPVSAVVQYAVVLEVLPAATAPTENSVAEEPQLSLPAPVPMKVPATDTATVLTPIIQIAPHKVGARSTV